MKFRAPGNAPVAIALLSGHTISITNDPAGTDVPVIFRREALARGCVPIGVEIEEKQKPAKKTAAEKRVEEIRAAIKAMLDSEDDAAFGTDGKPDTEKLSKLVGFKVKDEERDEVWTLVAAEEGLTGSGGE